jgi:hypothetical protein
MGLTSLAGYICSRYAIDMRRISVKFSGYTEDISSTLIGADGVEKAAGASGAGEV